MTSCNTCVSPVCSHSHTVASRHLTIFCGWATCRWYAGVMTCHVLSWIIPANCMYSQMLACKRQTKSATKLQFPDTPVKLDHSICLLLVHTHVCLNAAAVSAYTPDSFRGLTCLSSLSTPGARASVLCTNSCGHRATKCAFNLFAQPNVHSIKTCTPFDTVLHVCCLQGAVKHLSNMVNLPCMH